MVSCENCMGVPGGAFNLGWLSQVTGISSSSSSLSGTMKLMSRTDRIIAFGIEGIWVRGVAGDGITGEGTGRMERVTGGIVIVGVKWVYWKSLTECAGGPKFSNLAKKLE